MWYRKLYDEFISIGFKASFHDKCSFISKHGGDPTWALVCVDGLQIASHLMERLDAVVINLKESFDMTDLPNVSLYLDMNMQRDCEARTIIIRLHNDSTSRLSSKHNLS